MTKHLVRLTLNDGRQLSQVNTASMLYKPSQITNTNCLDIQTVDRHSTISSRSRGNVVSIPAVRAIGLYAVNRER